MVNEKKIIEKPTDSFGGFFKNLSGNQNDGNAPMYMMMIDMYKNMLEAQRDELRELRAELRDLRDKKSDVRSELEQAISLAKLAGGGESNSWAAAITAFGPQLGDVLANIAKTFAAAKAGVPVNANRPALPPKPNPQLPPAQPPQPANDLGVMFNDLHKFIADRDTAKFPFVAQVIRDLFGGEPILQGIANGAITQTMIIETLIKYGSENGIADWKAPAFTELYLKPYVEGFVKWLAEKYSATTTHAPHEPGNVSAATLPTTEAFHNMPPETSTGSSVAPSTPVDMASNAQGPLDKNLFWAECNQCHQMYSFDTKEDFDAETDHICGANLLKDGKTVVCQGTLVHVPSEEL